MTCILDNLVRSNNAITQTSNSSIINEDSNEIYQDTNSECDEVICTVHKVKDYQDKKHINDAPSFSSKHANYLLIK